VQNKTHFSRKKFGVRGYLLLITRDWFAVDIAASSEAIIAIDTVMQFCRVDKRSASTKSLNPMRVFW